jgi:hypothetical protein
VAEAVALKPATGVAFMIVTVRGKIVRSRRYQQEVLTAIVCPAKDEWSKPQTVQVRSKRKLGEVEEVVVVDCELGGYERKQYEVHDKDTGETTRIKPVEHTLDAVE